MKTGDEADKLFDQAGKKYAAALKIKPDKHEVLNNWGSALLSQYRISPNNKKMLVLEKAKDRLEQSESLVPGYAAYNLACFYSITGEPKKCHSFLLKSKEAKQLPEQKHLEDDVDLDPVRNAKWFKEFLETLD